MDMRNVKKHHPDSELSLNLSRTFLRLSLAALALSIVTSSRSRPMQARESKSDRKFSLCR